MKNNIVSTVSPCASTHFAVRLLQETIKVQRSEKREQVSLSSIWLGLMYKIPVVGNAPKIWNV